MNRKMLSRSDRPLVIGYARVSTEEQNLDLQLRALKNAGCDHIFADHGRSGKVFDRPALKEALQSANQGDVIVVWRLDRLGRSLLKLVELVESLGKRGVEFRSMNENIDTCSPGGRLIFHIMAALAEFERNLISERTRAGLEAAKERGSRLGRKPRLSCTEISRARKMIVEGSALREVARLLSVDPRTLRRSVAAPVEKKCPPGCDGARHCIQSTHLRSDIKQTATGKP